MTNKEINLISDTITRPTPEMLNFMMKAKVGDDVFNSDPTVLELQTKIAKLFGMEAALFFPSGTMANQTAIKLHTQPAEQLICDKWSHVYNYESGGASFHSGVSCKLIDGHRGMFKAEQLSEVIHDPKQYYLPLSSLVVVENTTNKGGGACWDYHELEKIQQVCRANGLSYHLGGLSEALEYRRKDKPRMNIKKGDVALAGNQTGIYPRESPGGWNIIGNSPLNFFNVEEFPPCFAVAGDKVKFVPVDKKEYEAIKKKVESGDYKIESEIYG